MKTITASQYWLKAILWSLGVSVYRYILIDMPQGYFEEQNKRGGSVHTYFEQHSAQVNGPTDYASLVWAADHWAFVCLFLPAAAGLILLSGFLTVSYRLISSRLRALGSDRPGALGFLLALIHTVLLFVPMHYFLVPAFFAGFGILSRTITDHREASGTISSELAEIQRLHSSGALSNEEFQTAKQRVLNKSA